MTTQQTYFLVLALFIVVLLWICDHLNNKYNKLQRDALHTVGTMRDAALNLQAQTVRLSKALAEERAWREKATADWIKHGK